MNDRITRERLKEIVQRAFEGYQDVEECWIYGPYLDYADGHVDLRPENLDVAIRFAPGHGITSSEMDQLRNDLYQAHDNLRSNLLFLTGAPYDQCGIDEISVYALGCQVLGKPRDLPDPAMLINMLLGLTKKIPGRLEECAKDPKSAPDELDSLATQFERMAQQSRTFSVIVGALTGSPRRPLPKQKTVPAPYASDDVPPGPLVEGLPMPPDV